MSPCKIAISEISPGNYYVILEGIERSDPSVPFEKSRNINSLILFEYRAIDEKIYCLTPCGNIFLSSFRCHIDDVKNGDIITVTKTHILQLLYLNFSKSMSHSSPHMLETKLSVLRNTKIFTLTNYLHILMKYFNFSFDEIINN